MAEGSIKTVVAQNAGGAVVPIAGMVVLVEDAAGNPQHVDVSYFLVAPSGDAISLRGVALDASVGSPTDGKILVYRSAGGNWILEDKPGTLSPWANASGDQTTAASGQSRKLTGNVSGIPIMNGWWQKYLNVSGVTRVITPASGTVLDTNTGTFKASVSLPNNKSCIVHADGTNLIMEGGAL